MPRIEQDKLVPSDIYGKAQIDNTLTMGQRIRKRFKPADTVKVHNPTNVPIRWQWLEESDESYTIEDGSNIKIVERNDPGVWELGAGEVDILQGSCAYIMIEALYKQTSVMKNGIVLHPLDEREIRNFGFDDPQKQEEFIDMVFRGKLTPQLMQQAALGSMDGDFKPKTTIHLPKLADEHSEFERRTGQSSQQRIKPLTPKLSELTDLQGEFEQTTGDESKGEATDEQPKPKAVSGTTPNNRSKVAAQPA